MRLLLSILVFLILCYVALLGPFTLYLKDRPVQEKMGYIPRPQALRILAADNKELMAAALVIKSMTYFGGIVDKQFNRLGLPPDFPGMYEALTTALKLDPYNIDAYYFCQAFLVWDVGEIHAANRVLEYGMKYRTWDFYLPLFAGFNNAYFLKDYEKAARYYRRAGELSNNELYISLAGKYFYEAGKTAMAIDFLERMIMGTRNEAVRRNLGIRLIALEGVKIIEDARDSYFRKYKKLPISIDQLLMAGLLDRVPRDPYGGEFFLDKEGQVRTTSKFSFSKEKQIK